MSDWFPGGAEWDECDPEEIPGLAQYLPDELETADLVAKTVPPTKLKIKKGNICQRRLKNQK